MSKGWREGLAKEGRRDGGTEKAGPIFGVQLRAGRVGTSEDPKLPTIGQGDAGSGGGKKKTSKTLNHDTYR